MQVSEKQQNLNESSAFRFVYIDSTMFAEKAYDSKFMIDSNFVFVRCTWLCVLHCRS